MEKSNHMYPPWGTRFREPGTELRFLNNKYYLYQVKAQYDPQTKKSKKITGRLLGRITEQDGFIESSKKKLADKASAAIDVSKIATREWGFTLRLWRGF